MNRKSVAASVALLILVLVLSIGLLVTRDLTSTAKAQTESNLEQYGTVVTVTRVVDGDTVDIDPAIDGVDRVRLIGVNTPEVSGEQEPGGPEASAFTTEQLEGEQVALEFDEERVDRYGRLLAYIWLPGGELFNETLVREGYAEVATFPPNVKYESRFEAAEEEARAEISQQTTPQASPKQKQGVIKGTVPRRRLAPTGGPSVSAIVVGSVLVGGSLIGLGLLVRRGR